MKRYRHLGVAYLLAAATVGWTSADRAVPMEAPQGWEELSRTGCNILNNARVFVGVGSSLAPPGERPSSEASDRVALRNLDGVLRRFAGELGPETVDGKSKLAPRRNGAEIHHRESKGTIGMLGETVAVLPLENALSEMELTQDGIRQNAYKVFDKCLNNEALALARPAKRPSGSKPFPSPPPLPEASSLPPSPPPEPLAEISDDLAPRNTLKPYDRFFALVVGIEQYRDVPAAQYAAKDAEKMQDYLVQMMGFPEENVIFLSNERATKNDIKKYMGEWLPRNLDKRSRFLFYFAGHGAPDPEKGDAYLLPYDGDPNFLETTGIPLKQLYSEIQALPASDAMVLMDACFSGAGGRSLLAQGARPLVTKLDNAVPAGRKVMVLSASTGSEITSALPEKGHGLFTYYLLKGLEGEADGDADGWVTVSEAYSYLLPKVQKMARRQNRDQNAQLIPSSQLLGEKASMRLSKVR